MCRVSVMKGGLYMMYRGPMLKHSFCYDMFNEEEMFSLIETGLASRTVGSTLMNEFSSRSHAIFTITLEQHYTTSTRDTPSMTETTVSKFRLVDLAGCERAKRIPSKT